MNADDCGSRAGFAIHNPKTGSAFDQPDITGARALLGFLRSELHALAFAEQLEHRTANGAAVKEMLKPALVADEPKPLSMRSRAIVPVGITRSPPFRSPKGIPGGLGRLRAPAREVSRDVTPAE